MNDTTKPSEYLGYWGEKYKNDLLTDILEPIRPQPLSRKSYLGADQRLR